MNDNLQPLPNEHLEARITAWVLGQASPFEAAELEALCAADPELQLFLNRTKALHSLLLETPPSTSDQFWKLSPENRAKLDPIIGPNSSTPSHKNFSIRRAAYRTAFGIAAVLAITVFIKRSLFVSLSKESSTLVSYSKETEKFNAPAAEDFILNETVEAKKSKSVASSLKPSAPSFSAPAQAMERDTTLALADRTLEKGLSEGGRREYRQSAGEAPRSRMESQEFDATKAETQTSSMSKVIAAASNSSATIPVPNVDLTTPSMDFGDGKDFGGGWGGAQGNAVAGKNDGGIGYMRFEGEGGGGGGANRDMSNTALATEALAATDDAFASNESRQKGGFTYEAEKFKNATESATVPGIPSETATSTRSGTTAGLRSGDYAIQRESIDAILNNPDRTATDGVTLLPASKSETQPDDLAFSDPDTIRNNPSILKGKEGETQLGISRPLSAEHAQQVDEVRRDLYKAQGNYDLGKYDDAKKSYEDILRIDPHNEAARRGMEKIADTKSDYYRAAYSDTRSELLMQVDKAWELSVPADEAPAVDPFAAIALTGKDQSYSELDLYGQKETPDLATNGFFKDLSSLIDTGVAYNQKNNSAPAEFEGFVNYGAPIENQPKQIDITTKHVEIAQENNKELGFDWSVTNISGTISSGVKVDIPLLGNSSEYLYRGANLGADIAETEAVPLLGDIPLTGRLFQTTPPSLSDLSNELSTTEEVFSTFSLNISDASFQLASAAIAKGERPDPASIKPEQFYNAVDYGDPAPSASEPVAAAIDQTAHPVIPGRNLVRVAVRTASAGRSAAQPLRLTLLVDQSGSMVRADRRAAMETALASLATLLTEQDRITVIGFSRTPHLLAQSLPGNEASKLSDIINQTASEGGTNLEQAINLATDQAISHQLAGAQNRIVLFTDGAANLGDADPERLSKKIQDLRQQGLAFDIAGIGTNDVNDRLLSDLARHGNGRYYLVGEKTGGNLAAQLAGAFRPAAENVKVQVKLNPQRVGNYKLIGFEKDRLKTEDFRNDTVDAAELAADEAGVALYQVETLPEGTGEIGEVSVRFRDTASGEMVERKWTIPYDASAPSFDKANPKTQLATLALLAAQKLQTGPLADAIDFSNYSETIAKLKQANANSSKTQQLLNLINALK